MVCANGFWYARVNVICYKNPLKKYVVVRIESEREFRHRVFATRYSIAPRSMRFFVATRLIFHSLPT